MKSLYNRLAICLVPCLIAAWIVGVAIYRYELGQGGFKLGVDLVGGTILVYEVDLDKFPDGKLPANFKGEDLVSTLQKRINPDGLKDITIRSVSNTRVEIILPTGGAHQARIEEERWKKVVEEVKKKFGVGDALDSVGRGDLQGLTVATMRDIDARETDKLIAASVEKWPNLKDKLEALKKNGKPDPAKVVAVLKEGGVKDEEASKFVTENYKPTTLSVVDEFVTGLYKTNGQRQDISAEEVQRIKEQLRDAGSLEFRILANTHDDVDGIKAASDYIEGGAEPTEKTRTDRQEELRSLAERGLPPPAPINPTPIDPKQPTLFTWSNQLNGSGREEGQVSYSWVEIGKEERTSLKLNNWEVDNTIPGAPKKKPQDSFAWNQAREAREKGKAVTLHMGDGEVLLYSRECLSRRLSAEERKDKQFEYFLLVRDPEPNKKISGKDMINADVGQDGKGNPAITFEFNSAGGALFYEVTKANRPTGNPIFHRQLAIILDDKILSAPSLNEPIHSRGQITGKFKHEDVVRYVTLLRSGALPASLKGVPVSENTIGPTLGADTIASGTFSVFIAFVAILLFMVIYYHAAGVIACIALLANLLLTIAFMVTVAATFTLPGLAGLVLMLGMAVDANVLIYERIREERDRGATMVLAIRNGYDRAFPTIIDTHLSSIFTALVLWAIGTDQLKGFGISLTFGLVISLFTSLYMTRFMFDLAMARNWKRMTNLTMFRLLTKTNIDFMAIRHYWFAATIILTILGMGLFLSRGKQGLNIDFNGGTAYTGQLKTAVDISYLRELLRDPHHRLALDPAKPVEQDSETRYTLNYQDGTKQTVEFADPPAGPGAPKEAQEKALAERAEKLPDDLSVEQIFLSGEDSTGNRSKFFTVRSPEKAPDLVQVSLDRLFWDKDSLLNKVTIVGDPKVTDGGKKAELTFSDSASPSNVKTLLERAARTLDIPDNVVFDVIGVGPNKDGRFQTMRVEIANAGTAGEAKLNAVLKKTKEAFDSRPQPERLENFDSQLATETQTRALYAILTSWAAILLYLWFRFGTWTFGLAAVMCLIHDLFFTLGAIALCHYVHIGMPWLATVFGLHDFKIDLPTVAALLTLVGYSVNDTIVVFDRIREVRGKSPELTPKMINDSVNQTLSRTLLTAFSVFLVVVVLYFFGGEGVHLFAFVMVVGVIVGTYSSIYIASPLLLIFGEGKPKTPAVRETKPKPQGAAV